MNFLAVIERSTFTGLTNYYNSLVEKLKTDGTSLASKIPNVGLFDDDAVQINVNDSVVDGSNIESGSVLENSVKNVIFNDRRGLVRQRSVAPFSPNSENLESIVFLLKIIVVALMFSVFIQIWFGMSTKHENGCLNHKEFQDLKKLVGELAVKLDSLQKHIYGNVKKQEL